MSHDAEAHARRFVVNYEIVVEVADDFVNADRTHGVRRNVNNSGGTATHCLIKFALKTGGRIRRRQVWSRDSVTQRLDRIDAS